MQKNKKKKNQQQNEKSQQFFVVTYHPNHFVHWWYLTDHTLVGRPLTQNLSKWRKENMWLFCRKPGITTKRRRENKNKLMTYHYDH